MVIKDPETRKRKWREWYHKNKKDQHPKIYASRKKRRQERIDRINLFKSTTPCADCGNIYPAICMDFDHQHSKKTEISVLVHAAASWEVLEKELSKCELVCSNCHRIRTHLGVD